MDKIYINAKYRPVVIVPHPAIRPNFDFWLLSDKDKKDVVLHTKDGIAAKVTRCESRTIFDLKDEIQSLYNVNAWEYLCRWNDACENQLTSLSLWRIELTKEE